jgi:hypothetical protein
MNDVTAVHFMANKGHLLSASLDGIIQAWDMFYYPNFRTITSPSPRQFVSLIVDQSGEVICAGTLDSFEVCVNHNLFVLNFHSSYALHHSVSLTIKTFSCRYLFGQ